MSARYFATLILPVLFCGCAASVDVDSMLRDYDDYEKDVRAVATDPHAIQTLDAAQAKRTEAGALAEKGDKNKAVPKVEEAMADARLALEVDQAMASARRAEKCRLEVEQSRKKWSEAVFVLEQTEEFVGKDAPTAKLEPETAPAEAALPASTLTPDSFPPASMNDVAAQWTAWRKAASDSKVAVAELEGAYRKSFDATQAAKVDAATEAHNRYLAARAVQSLECRVRDGASEQVCVDATAQMAAYGDAREGALRATLELERTLQDDLRRDLDQLRAEAKTRQDELFDALSQMEGKFASIHRDARGTIVSLADILFDFDKATLRRDVEFNLVKIATILNQFGEMKILIEGHTDAIGTDEYNLGLSKRRAQAVHDFLVSQDVAATRLSWDGYGESRPVADNTTDEGRQKNRRVDLVIQDAPQ
ncbi:MAG TPA: OmpA family protein [Candidatus Krumholzibacteria bacterium]|nr:OmpA family protein [Candidatus Krumholzibacteria bacterium]